MSTTPAFLALPAYNQENCHRRLLLGGVGTLLILSLSPIFGHHLSERVDTAVLSQDHVLGLCLIALHTLVGPVHSIFHLLLGLGLAYAIWDRGRAMLRLRRTLELLPVDNFVRPRLAELVQSAGLARSQVRIVAGLPNPAFTAGWFRPRVYLARGVCDALTDAELTAVLRHEAEHVRRRDPLRLSLLRFLACTLFWIPAFRRLSEDVADEAEICADDAGAREQPLALASAILALASWSRRGADTLQLVRIAPDDIASLVLLRHGAAESRYDVLLDRRIRRLAGESVPLTSHVTRRSLSGAAFTLAAVWLSGVIVAHPMPALATNARAPHCEHSGVSALSHVFCLHADAQSGTARMAGDAHCPHAHMAG